MNRMFWKDKKVFITGHTGFKGSWLSIWLNLLGADVTGYSLKPPTCPSLFELCKLDNKIKTIIGDIRDRNLVAETIISIEPEIIIHLAAQPLVRESYKHPVDTYETNVIGTINVLEAVRKCNSVRSVVNVTTDKCYENKEWYWSYRENESMGGYDPYSNSKSCSELITNSYRKSFFNLEKYKENVVALASARAGNVIGGGDWAKDRLIPDCIDSLLNGEKIIIRNPNSIRPWQHVLEPLNGYLNLAQKLYENGIEFAEGWNFGPNEDDAKPVLWIVKKICETWGIDSSYQIYDGKQFHEANYLKLDCSKAKAKLGWYPKWNLDTSINKIVEWVLAFKEEQNMLEVCNNQIKEYMMY